MTKLFPDTVWVGALLVLLTAFPVSSQEGAPAQASADGKLTVTVAEAVVRGDTLTMKITLANISQESVEL